MAPGGSRAARKATARFFDLITEERKRVHAIAAQLGLSHVQSFMIWRLAAGGGISMAALAELCGCDPSNLTGIADKLEARGLLRRTASPGDRRVRILLLTAEGRAMRARIVERFLKPPIWITSLSVRDQTLLAGILDRCAGLARAPSGQRWGRQRGGRGRVARAGSRKTTP